MSPQNPMALQIVRYSLAVWVGIVAAAAMVLRREPARGTTLLAVIAVLASAAAVLGVFILRERAARAAGAEARSSVIIAWALGEAAAMTGWIVHLLGAPLPWALPGTAVFILAIVLVAPPAAG